MHKILLFCLYLTLTLALPDQFSWGGESSRTYLGPILNQNNPNRCQSGWAIAATSAISARINIAMKKNNFTSALVSLSAQSLLQCDNLNYGCLGGDPGQALRWILRNNITDSSCNNYKAKGYTNGLSCSSKSKCQSCWSKDKCSAIPQSKIYSIDSTTTIGGENDMQAQIMENGPIICGVNANANFKKYSKGIYQDMSGEYNHNHYVMVYGWGEEDGNKYWLIQNSYGPTWGQDGTIRLLRGNNNLGIEALCYGAKVVDTWTKDIRNVTLQTNNQPVNAPIGRVLTASLSQLTPNYCDASWAFAVVHALADAQLIRSSYRSSRSFSVQALLNCGIGSCQKGGNPHDALSFISRYGLPQQGCMQYRSLTPQHQSCSSINNCASCQGNSIFTSNCTQVKGYRRWKIINYGNVVGASNMSRQISNHHAIICGVQATSAFRQYRGNGIFSQNTINPKINYWVQVVGEGSQGGIGYWIGRTSYGTTWGNNGFFKIKKGSNNLGIQTKCYWAGNLI